MQKESKSIVWGIILILAGLIFLGNNLNWWDVEWGNVWPLFLIGGGLLFWVGWFTSRKDVGVLMPGTILITYGLLFQYCAMYGWYWMDELWPIFLLGPGLGFFAMYFLGEKEKGTLLAGSILVVLAILFWIGHDLSRYFWPLLLIGIGIFLLFSAQKKRDKRNRIQDMGQEQQNAEEIK